jgi:hypothetical protein
MRGGAADWRALLVRVQEDHAPSKAPFDRTRRPVADGGTVAHHSARRRASGVCASAVAALVVCAGGLLPSAVRAQDPLYQGRVLAPSGAIGTERGITLEVTHHRTPFIS